MLSLIVAVDKNNGIGKNNDLPWRIPEDLKYFKRVTTGSTVIMGRKTYESIGRPLPNRENIVLTRDDSLEIDGVTVLSRSIKTIGTMLPHTVDECFVIGGAQIFNELIDSANKLYMTYIDEEFDCDTFFNWNEEEWKLVSEGKGLKDEKNPYDYYFRVYERTTK